MEEIVIPHTSTPVPQVGEDRIRIDHLDDIAQLVFKGTKTLNRIQTIVFDAAYYTNENLLISAPTGAGKTNIAMLTVLHEIKKNIEAGVIKKDKFKVCVSPTLSLSFPPSLPPPPPPPPLPPSLSLYLFACVRVLTCTIGIQS